MNIYKIEIPTPFPVGNVNTFLVKGDTLSIFDSGTITDETYEKLKFELKNLGYQSNDIEQVILTHHHPDHSGGIKYFEKAKLLGHGYNDFYFKKEEEFLAYYNKFYSKYFRELGVPTTYDNHIELLNMVFKVIDNKPLDIILKDGESVPGHENLTVIESLGHAQSHLCFFDFKTRELIGGDILLQKISPNPLLEPPINLSMNREKSQIQYNKSLKKLLDLDPSIIYLGHGEEILDPANLINMRFDEQRKKSKKLIELLDVAKTCFNLTKELYPKIFEKQLTLTLFETLGQLDFALSENYIDSEIIDGVTYYKKIL